MDPSSRGWSCSPMPCKEPEDPLDDEGPDQEDEDRSHREGREGPP